MNCAAVPHRPHGDLVDADDRHFGMVDDRRRHDAAHRAERGDGDGRAGQLVARRPCRRGRRSASRSTSAAQSHRSRASAWRTTGTIRPLPVCVAMPIWTPPWLAHDAGLVVEDARSDAGCSAIALTMARIRKGRIVSFGRSSRLFRVERGAQILQRGDVDLLDIGDGRDARHARSPSSRRCGGAARRS